VPDPLPEHIAARGEVRAAMPFDDVRVDRRYRHLICVAARIVVPAA
jgi:hypothetical protein